MFTDGNANEAQTLRLSDEDFDTVDRRMHVFLHPFNIVKLKIFSKEKEII